MSLNKNTIGKSKICIVGSGNWATALARNIAENVAQLSDMDDQVNMYVYAEMFEGKQLNEIINVNHINPKYLPEVVLPKNVIAMEDLVEAAKNADILIFSMPSKFIVDFCKTLMGKIKPEAQAVSMVKGFIRSERGAGGGIQLISATITKYLKIPCSVLVTVNLATEILSDFYCEATLGTRDMKNAQTLKKLFERPNFRVSITDDVDCVEVCGLLKYLIAFGIGLLDGLDSNQNIKSACVRFGLLEMIRFIDISYPGSKLATFFESCGISDLITVSQGSRNRLLAEAFVKTGHQIEQLEVDILAGEKLLGPLVAKEANYMIKAQNLMDKFPLFTMIHEICDKQEQPQALMDCICNMPVIIYYPVNILPL